MIGNKDLLPEAEIQQRARDFLLTKYPECGVTVSSTQLATKEGTPIFQVAGTIETKSRSDMQRFIFRSHPNRFSFSIELDAKQGTIFNYELR